MADATSLPRTPPATPDLLTATPAEATYADLPQAQEAWARIHALRQQIRSLPEKPTPAIALAPRWADQQQIAGHRPYIHASHLLEIAYEHHQAFAQHITTLGIGPTASFSLLRPALETSLLALWVLDPDDSHTRRVRGLKLDVLNLKEESAWLKQLGKTTDGRTFRDHDAERAATAGASLRAEAEELKVTYRDLQREKIIMVDEIPRLQHLTRLVGANGAHFVAAEWRRLSAYEHAKAWASQLGSDTTPLGGIAGGQKVHLVASDSSITNAITITTLMTILAQESYIARSVNA